MTKQEEKEALLATAKYSSQHGLPSLHKSGGQQVAVIPRGVTLTSEESNFEITVNAHRSQMANRQLAYLLFQLYIDEITK